MFLTKKFNLGLTLMLFCILLSACGPSPEELAATSAAETAAAATSTSTMTPTSTPISTPTATQVPPTKNPTSTPKPPTPTIEPMPGLLSEGILVVYDGKKCKASTPPELSPGEYTVIFRKDNEEKYILEAELLLQGKTFQDLVNAQVVPGRYWGRPSWLAYYRTTSPPLFMYACDYQIGIHLIGHRELNL